VIVCVLRHPEDGTPLPKHVEVTRFINLLYDLYFIVFYWGHLLVYFMN
jgi:hypothetical protein